MYGLFKFIFKWNGHTFFITLRKKQIYCDCCKTHKISSHKIFTRENIIVQLVLKLQQEELARSRGRYKGNWRIWSHNRSLLFSVIIASFILDDCCRHEYAEGKFLLFKTNKSIVLNKPLTSAHNWNSRDDPSSINRKYFSIKNQIIEFTSLWEIFRDKQYSGLLFLVSPFVVDEMKMMLTTASIFANLFTHYEHFKGFQSHYRIRFNKGIFPILGDDVKTLRPRPLFNKVYTNQPQTWRSPSH